MGKFKEGDQVICIDPTFNRLTLNKIYNVLPDQLTDRAFTIRIVNDLGHNSFYDEERFISIMEYRSKTIDDIIDYGKF